MGHYDDSYASSAERVVKERNENNKKANKKIQQQLNNVEATISDFDFSDEQQEHLFQKLTELRALLKFYI